MADASSLIFPIGHYLGARASSADSEPDHHVVRIGWDLYKMDRSAEFGIWALTHGVPDGSESPGWTRPTLAGAARMVGIPDVTASIDSLLERDLIIEVQPDTDEAIEFAQLCRTRSLLLGIGNTSAEPARYGIGLTAAEPSVRVGALAYEIWKWGHACDSLWHMCHILATADPDLGEPKELLARCLPMIQILLAHGAIYLDEAQENPDLTQ